MRLVHLSDLHLGFRQYQRQTSGGINQREADVALAFRRAVDQVIALRPDAVLFGGDIFHVIRPSNPAIIDAWRQLSKLVQALPDAAIVMVAGNHDTPRTSETGCILRLFEPLGIRVADRDAKRFTFERLGLSVLAVPETDDHPALAPDPAARWNVLLLHGEVRGMLPAHVERDRVVAQWTPEALAEASWDYVALGHYHVYRQVAPNAWYSGALEYASTNPWGDLREEREAGVPGKGFIEHDLATGAHRFHPVPGGRRLVDLPPIDASGRTAAELDTAIARALAACPGGLDDQIVRLVLRDVPRHVVRELDHKALREYKRRALHFQLDTRRPELVRPRLGEGAPGRRPSLREIVAERLGDRPLDADLDRDRFVALGLSYLDAADAGLPAVSAEEA
jgi:hypothetical protein